MIPRLVVGLAGLFFAAPLLWLAVAPFSSRATYALHWPEWTLSNFAKLLGVRGAVAAFGNSLLMSGAATLAVALMATLAGYALSRRSFPGRDLALYLLVLFSSVVTGVAAIVPLFSLLLDLDLLDTYLGVILVLSGGLLPGGLFIVKDFVDALPRAYEEASLVDGATPWQTFRGVAMPLLGSGTA
ncbi:MAG: ABC transporter permease subunit, partial [Candidatus Eremiobacterota bacterium]